MANNGIYYSSGNTLNFTTNNTTWSTLTSGGTFVMNAVSGGTYLNLPSTTFTGGTVSGATNFTGGLTANTISATTYYNLPYSGTVNGVGTTNFVSKWTGSTALGDSQIYDDGTFVGIGTSAKTYNETLNVYGNGGIVNNSINFVGHTINSISIADNDYSNWASAGNEIAIGLESPLLNSEGYGNIAIGHGVLQSNTSGNTNIAIGGQSLLNNLTGNDNVAIGNSSLYSNDEGTENISIGFQAGYNISTGSYNIFIGSQAGYSETTGSNKLYISNDKDSALIYGELDNGKVGINTISPVAELDVSGNTRITGTLTATTISATTYYNLPVTADTYVTGFTLSSNTITLSQNRSDSYSAFTISLSAYTGGTSGAYLPLSGGTVTGGTIFQSGLTANTISATSVNKVDYIVFNTGTTSAATVAGTVYFDNTQKALSYNTSISQGVTVNLGQQNYIRVFNISGTQIERGKALEIFSGSSGLPAVELAINRQNGNSIVGVSAEVIPNNSEGIAITYGIIDNIQLTGSSLGGFVYASDTVPGDLDSVTKYLNFPLTARTNVVGYVVQTGVTTGKLFVSINNENTVLSLTDLQRNVLEGNVISTGIFEFSGLSITAPSATTFNVAPVKAWIVDNTTDPVKPTVLYVNYSGGTNIPATNVTTATETYILLTSAATITQQTTFPTPQQRRQNVYLGKFGHGNKTYLINAFSEPDYDMSPISQLRDMFVPIKLINAGVIPSANGDNLTFNTSAGILYGLGINFINNVLNPNTLTVGGQTPATFQYRTQTGGTAANITTIDPGNYDLNGVVTSITGTKATNQRIYLLQNGQIRVQYGQYVYNNIASAIAAVQTEAFTTFSNFVDNAILIGVLSVLSTATVLNDTSKGQFFVVSKFGEVVGAAGGTSTTSLQQAYNNSSNPEILTNATLGALHIKNGTGNADNVSSLFDTINAAGVTTSFLRADGAFSGTSIFGTGLTATTISATTYLNLPSSTFTGGTVTGPTNFTNGLTATTISATTYQNLPSFNYVQITGTTQFSAGTNNNLNFSGINMTITSGSNNTLIFSAGTGSGGGVTSLTASDGISGNTTTGAVSIVNTDKGSSQNIFKNIQAGGVTQFSAGSNSSDLNFSGINITITSAATNTLVFSAGTGGSGGVTSITTGAGLSANTTTGAITIQATGATTFGVSVDGSGGVITTGQKGYVRIPYNYTITSWTVIGSPSGSITFDIWKASGAIPTVANTIIGGGGVKPSLSTATYATSSSLTNWTTTGSTGDVIGWNVDSCTTTTSAILQLFVTRTS